jgi:hypothetical protein
VLVYGVGWFVAQPRPEHIARRIRRWFALAALAIFLATFIMTAGELVRERLI